jgi:hypothetical protein
MVPFATSSFGFVTKSTAPASSVPDGHAFIERDAGRGS